MMRLHRDGLPVSVPIDLIGTLTGCVWPSPFVSPCGSIFTRPPCRHTHEKPPLVPSSIAWLTSERCYAPLLGRVLG